MATANVIKSKPYGLFVSSLSTGVLTALNVEVSTIIYIPGASHTTTAAVVLKDNAGDVFWQLTGGFSVTAGSLADFFTSGMRVEGINVTSAPSDSSCSLVIKLK
jgi:hypothetical protein